MKAHKLVFVGDSHTSFLGATDLQPIVLKHFNLADCHTFDCSFLYLGPKLAYSINGIVENLAYEVRANDFLLWYLGEIDIRCHFTRYKNSIQVAQAYYKQAVAFALKQGCKPAFILPVIPSNIGGIDQNYPRVGNILLRRLHYFLFCQTIRILCILGRVKCIGNFGEFSRLSLDQDMTDDGIHLNEKYNTLLLNKILGKVIC